MEKKRNEFSKQWEAVLFYWIGKCKLNWIIICCTPFVQVSDVGKLVYEFREHKGFVYNWLTRELRGDYILSDKRISGQHFMAMILFYISWACFGDIEFK